jgi:hypothetical protein
MGQTHNLILALCLATVAASLLIYVLVQTAPEIECVENLISGVRTCQ